MKHLIMYSGGICSWATAQRVIEKYGIENAIFLFADTIVEHDDLYRFLIQSIAVLIGVSVPECAFVKLPSFRHINARKEALNIIRKEAMRELPNLVWLSEGRTPWDVFQDVRFIGNSQTDPCSKILKRVLLNKWRKDNCDPKETITYFGLDWTEIHRLDKVRKMHAGWECEAPMADPPLLHKGQMVELALKYGVSPSTQYSRGVNHDNCGGFCCKAGQAAFGLLLQNDRDYYLYNEELEAKTRALVGDFSILKDRRGVSKGAEVKPLTLKQLRVKLETGQEIDRDDWGGCGCALE